MGSALTLQHYADRTGNSGVVAYALQPHAIVVEFLGGDTYLYTERSAGAQNIALMQRLAREGVGLSGFISRNVRLRYERKLR